MEGVGWVAQMMMKCQPRKGVPRGTKDVASPSILVAFIECQKLHRNLLLLRRRRLQAKNIKLTTSCAKLANWGWVVLY